MELRLDHAKQDFSKLEIVRPLGRGMTAEVFLGRDPRTNERFVVKRLRKHVLGVADLTRFTREAELMRKVAHPNLMPVVFVDSEAKPPYYVMPFREGRTLAEKLAQAGKLDQAVVCRIARDVCAGLIEVHRLGIVHRDVKPANLLFLEGSGRTIIFDFGLAKVVTADGALPLTVAGTILGSPAYMAPEQCRGDVVDGRTDVYALGVTLIELLLGKNPFAAPDVIETLKRQLSSVPRRLDALLPHRVSTELGELLHRMIAKEPRHRPNAETCLETFTQLCARYDRSALAATRGTIRPASVA